MATTAGKQRKLRCELKFERPLPGALGMVYDGARIFEDGAVEVCCFGPLGTKVSSIFFDANEVAQIVGVVADLPRKS